MRILTYRKTRGSKNVTRHERNAERISTEITTGDTVRVMRGENKDKEGKVIKVDLKAGRVTVEGPGFKMLKKHRRARRAEEQVDEGRVASLGGGIGEGGGEREGVPEQGIGRRSGEGDGGRGVGEQAVVAQRRDGGLDGASAYLQRPVAAGRR